MAVIVRTGETNLCHRISLGPWTSYFKNICTQFRTKQPMNTWDWDWAWRKWRDGWTCIWLNPFYQWAKVIPSCRISPIPKCMAFLPFQKFFLLKCQHCVRERSVPQAMEFIFFLSIWICLDVQPAFQLCMMSHCRGQIACLWQQRDNWVFLIKQERYAKLTPIAVRTPWHCRGADPIADRAAADSCVGKIIRGVSSAWLMETRDIRKCHSSAGLFQSAINKTASE